MKYAVCISDQGRFAPTCVGDFSFLPDQNLHVFKGILASSAKELSDQVNAAVASLSAYGSPFTTLRIVEISDVEEVEDVSTDESTKESLIQANAELNEVIKTIAPKPKKLSLVSEHEQIPV